MSPRERISHTVNWVFMIIATLAIVVGFFALADTQGKISDAQQKIKTETAARLNGQCKTLQKAVEPLRGIIELGTEPAPLDGLTPDRLAVVEAVNAQRAAARALFLPKVPTVNCTTLGKTTK